MSAPTEYTGPARTQAMGPILNAMLGRVMRSGIEMVLEPAARQWPALAADLLVERAFPRTPKRRGLHLLPSSPPGRLTIVGDPKPSIYRFRRADVAMYDRVRAIVLGSGERPLRPDPPLLVSARARD